jgi:hypothetical protein
MFLPDSKKAFTKFRLIHSFVTKMLNELPKELNELKPNDNFFVFFLLLSILFSFFIAQTINYFYSYMEYFLSKNDLN